MRPIRRPSTIGCGVWCAGAFDDVIFLTGEGLRRLLARAERTVDARRGHRRARARPPHHARAQAGARAARDRPRLGSAGQRADIARGDRQLAGARSREDRRVGLQLYGTDPGAELVAFLTAAGAAVSTVSPYIYAPAIDDQRVRELIDAMQAHRIDAIAFTSASQIDRLWGVARSAGIEPALAAALAATRVAAIGPVVESALGERGVRVDIATSKPFVMKHLVGLIAEKLGSS